MDDQMKWTFFKGWNDAIARPERVMTPRDHMWASELGSAYIDRFLKMTGEQPTNPPNMRSQRKFQAGHEWERVVKMILTFSGIHIADEKHLAFQYPGLLKVTGRADFIAGGTPNWSNARQKIAEYALLFDEQDNSRNMEDDFYMRIIRNMEASLGSKELKPIILEIKSCSAYMFEVYEQTSKPNPHHTLQLYHYLKSTGMDEGHVIYISKDDCRMIEFGVFNPTEKIEELYRTDIEKMTQIMASGVEPEKEPLIIFNEDRGKFSKNWKVEYSNYLHRLYGYEQPEDYDFEWKPLISSFNRTLGRVVAGKNMTKLNLEVIERMAAEFPNYEQIVAIAKSKGISEEGGEEI
jgi:hypothetical protein